MNILIKYFYLLLSFLLALMANSCAENDDFAIPEPERTTTTLSGTKITIAALKNQFDYQEEEIITFSRTKNYIEGYVVSSDEAGNFFKELVVQDRPENPTSGIQILIDQRSLYEKYDFGRKILIQLDGLSMGLDHGVLKLGKLQEKNIQAISEFEVENYIFRTEEIKEITPKEVEIADFNNSIESIFVKLTSMQFTKELIENPAKTLAGSSNDRFQGERELVFCKTQETVILSTSVFADFKSLSLPPSQGSVAGVLSKDFFGNYYVLRINTSDALVFENVSRCDPLYVSCTLNDLSKSNTMLFEENFDTIKKDQQLDDLGWTNYNSNGDIKRWSNKKITNVDNRVMTISAFNTKLNPLEVWLVTPEIDFDQTTDEVFSFEVQTSFNNGKTLTVWATTDYTGNPDTTKWLPLDIKLPSKNANSVKTPPFSLSCLNGKLHLAFRYNGRDPGATSTYSLDNIKIYGVKK